MLRRGKTAGPHPALLIAMALALAVSGCTSAATNDQAAPNPSPTAPAVATPIATTTPFATPVPVASAQPTPTPSAKPTSDPSTECVEPAETDDMSVTVLDLDQDGRDELITISPLGQRYADATLLVNDDDGCATLIGATGQSFGSAGSPQGFGCLPRPDGSLRFVDWEQDWFTYSRTGTDTISMSLVSWRLTSLDRSVPTTTDHQQFALAYGGEGIEICSDDARRPRETVDGVIFSESDADIVIYARPADRCVNDHLGLAPPPGWSTVLTEPEQSYGPDRQLRCSIFSPDPFGVPLQCDCYLPINIGFLAGASLDEIAERKTVIRTATVDGYDAIVTQDSVQSELYGDYETWTWFIDKRDGLVVIEANTAETDISITELAALVDVMASTATVHGVAPPDRPCATAPGDPSIGPTFYLDLDSDGIYEALAPHSFNATGDSVVTLHQVLAADEACGWRVIQQLPRDPSLLGRHWECVLHPSDGLRVRTRVETEIGAAVTTTTAGIWAGAQRLDFTTSEALALEAVPCGAD